MKERYFLISDSTDSIDCKMYTNDSNKEIKRVMICCHGICGNKENRAVYKIADHFVDHYKDLGIFCFDWPCHGKDVKQKLSLVDCDRYFTKVLDYIKTEMKVSEIYLQATSFGGYLSFKYLHEHENPFKKIAFRAPAVNMISILFDKVLDEAQAQELEKGKSIFIGDAKQRKLKITPEFLAELRANDLSAYDFIELADDIIVVQGNNDELVDPDLVENFCTDNVIECYRLDGTNHIFSDPAKLKKAIDYIDEHFALSK